MIELGASPGFVGIGDVFAQVIDGDARTQLIDGLGRAQRVFHLRASNEPTGNSFTNRRAFGRRAQRAALRKLDEERSQHCLSSKLLKSEPGMPRAFMKITEVCITIAVNLKEGAVGATVGSSLSAGIELEFNRLESLMGRGLPFPLADGRICRLRQNGVSTSDLDGL